MIKALRPVQWTKNFFMFACLLFSLNFFHHPRLILIVALAFVIFCGLSSSAYLFNDLQDLEEDRRHPVKSARPLAAGTISPRQAWMASILLASAGLASAYVLNRYFFMTAVGYLLLQIAYSLKLKHVVVLDVMAIGLGFVLRVVAGGLVIAVPISTWLLICTSLLSVFLALGKRRYELHFLGEEASNHRSVLEHYSFELLDLMISIVTSSLLIAYCLYTISGITVARYGGSRLLFSMPLVLYGIFRYLFLIYQRGGGGSPEESIIRDKPLMITIVLWVVTVAVIIYVF